MKQRNAARRHSRSALTNGRAPANSLGAAAAFVVIPQARSWPPPTPRLAWPPLIHPELFRIGRKRNRIFAAEVVRHVLAGEEFDDAYVSAMRAAFPRSCYSDDVLLGRGRLLGAQDPIFGVIWSLIEKRPGRLIPRPASWIRPMPEDEVAQ